MNLNENNNKQTIINELFSKRLSNITIMTNSILNAISKDNSIIDEIVVDLQSKIRLIKDELINIKYAIQWAKGNILNTVILNKQEVKVALEKLKAEEMPFNNAEEALEFSKINVLCKEMIIIYMVKIPLTSNETFRKIILRPVKKQNNIAINIQYDEILKCKNITYGIRKPCEIYNEISICNRNNLVDLSEDQCIPRLINCLNSSCSTMSGQHISGVEEVQPGIILLNNFNGQIEVNEAPQELNGTHLIQFYNSTVKINNQLYRNIASQPFEAIPSVLQLTPAEKGHMDILSLEVLQELHINNTKRIDFLRKTTFSIGTLTIVTIIALVGILIITRTRKSISIEYIGKSQAAQAEIPTGVLPSQTNKIPTYIKFNDLPFF
ncbi:uncharacterized protein [Eurosta solidaginis]|uniref:uncharacterized protein n=1 Tax=Eurosta solidaginis TaxID=178769 RepID=UPI003530DC4D